MDRVAVIAVLLVATTLPAYGETIDLACRYSPPSGGQIDSRLIIDSDRNTVSEIWSNDATPGKSYEYALTEVSAQFIRYTDADAQRTRRVTIDRIAGTLTVLRTDANGSTQTISYPCSRATQKF